MANWKTKADEREETMMRFTYTNEKSQSIIEHEEEMLEKYSEIAKGYLSDFTKYNCTLKMGISWGNKDYRSENRLPFVKGYECYAYCNVERNGNVIRYEDEEGELDYFELSASWCISSIFRSIFCLKVDLNEDVTLIVEEIEELLEIASSL